MFLRVPPSALAIQCFHEGHFPFYLLLQPRPQNIQFYSNVEDRKLLRSDTVSVNKWCLNNGINLNINTTTLISFNLRKNRIAFRYKVRRVLKTLGCSHALSSFSQPCRSGRFRTFQMSRLIHHTRLFFLLPCIALLFRLTSNLCLSSGIL